LKAEAQKRLKSKVAISAILGAILMTGVTLAVGFAVWAWARNAAVASENNFGTFGVGTSINATNEKLVIANANFSNTVSQNVTLWFYNYGSVASYVRQIWISNSTWTNSTQRLSSTQVKVDCNQGGTSCLYVGNFLQISPGAVQMATFKVNTSFKPGVLYQFKILTIYGNTYTYQQTR
jgi:hypothetical protein